MIHFLGDEQADIAPAAIELPPPSDLLKRGGAGRASYCGTATLRANATRLRVRQLPAPSSCDTGSGVIGLRDVAWVLVFPSTAIFGHEVGVLGTELTEARSLPHGVFAGHRSIIAEGSVPSWAKKVVVEPDTKDDD